MSTDTPINSSNAIGQNDKTSDVIGQSDLTNDVIGGHDRNESKVKDQVPRVLTASLVAALGSLNFGYALGFSSPIQSKIEESSEEFFLTSEQFSWFASLVAIGAIFGSILGGVTVDRYGRKMMNILSAIPYVIGWLFIAYAESVAAIYFGRILSGIGIGMSALIVPVYVSEISSARLRGGLCSIHALFITTGMLVAYIAGWKLSWRWAAIFPVALVCFMVLLMVWMPETPRWLLANGKHDQAIAELTWLRGEAYDVEGECFEIQTNLEAANKESISFADFLQPNLYRPLIVGFLLMFFQQFSGFMAVIAYNESIFDEAGVHNSAAMSICVIMAQFLAHLLACFIVDRSGRRILLLVGSVGMAVCLFGLGLYFDLVVTSDKSAISVFGHISHTIPVSQISWLAITSVVVYIILFSLGWGPLPWVLMAEIFPPRARGISSGAIALSNFLFVFVTTKLFNNMKQTIHQQGTFWLFAAFSVLSFFFVLFGVLETKGKTLEQIEQHYSRSTGHGVQGNKLLADCRRRIRCCCHGDEEKYSQID